MLKSILKKFSYRRPAAAIAAIAPLTPDKLLQFSVFSHLSYSERLVFSNKLQQEVLQAGETLFRVGSTDPLDFLLLSGTLSLRTVDDDKRTLVGGTDTASRVVAGLRPRKYTATALTPCIYIAINPETHSHLAKFQSRTQVTTGKTSETPGYHVEEIPKTGAETKRSVEAHHLFHTFRQDLDANRFVLTSIPEVALRIRRTMHESEVPVEDVAGLVNSDPVIATKIIKTANSAFYQGIDPCISVTDAVVRLGIKTTRQLVLCFALRDIFAGNIPELRFAMSKAWTHTVYIGAIAAVLARESGRFSPEEGMLAAILSNIGVLSVFNYLESYPEIYKNPVLLQETVDELKSEAGALVLEQWDFSPELIECARSGEQWGRDGTVEADLCDLVITASLHGYIGRRKIPRIDQVGACRRLLGDKLVPEFAAQFLQNAQSDIELARSLLSG